MEKPEFIAEKDKKRHKKTPTVARRSFFSYRQMSRRLCELYIDSVQAFFTLLGVERDHVAFADFVNQTADVNKNFFARV